MSDQQLYCPVRKLHVQAQPEEEVRQKLIHFLTERLHFPLSGLAVEKALHQMPHLALKSKDPLPDRRADIVCFARGIHPAYDLYPLLLIECKAVPLNQSTIQQVLGYNRHLGAHFVAIANADEVKLGWNDPESGETRFVPYIPTYDQLLRSISQAG